MAERAPETVTIEGVDYLVGFKFEWAGALAKTSPGHPDLIEVDGYSCGGVPHRRWAFKPTRADGFPYAARCTATLTGPARAAEGVAKCSLQDKFTSQRARGLSLNRAALAYGFTREQRKALHAALQASALARRLAKVRPPVCPHCGKDPTAPCVGDVQA